MNNIQRKFTITILDRYQEATEAHRKRTEHEHVTSVTTCPTDPVRKAVTASLYRDK
jgi:hypothetical protein